MAAESVLAWPEYVSLSAGVVSVVIAVLAWLAARKSTNIAERAQTYAEAQPTEAAWDSLLVAVAALQTFDPNGNERARPLLTELRTRATLLIDRLQWPGFDQWIAAESQLGASLMGEALERGEARRRDKGGLSTEDHVELGSQAWAWVSALFSNLRLLRREGFQPDKVERLRVLAVDTAMAVAERNGWEPPPDKVPGVSDLDD